MNGSLLRSSMAVLSGAMSLTCLAAALDAAPAAGAAQSGTFDLFTAAEASAWNTRTPASQRSLTNRSLSVPVPQEAGCHSVPPASPAPGTDPQIKILSPSLGMPLNAPVDIDLQFVPAGTAIRPETFRVCYVGFLTMDITQRITDRVAVSPAGIKVTGAQLPSGHHHLLMLIADQNGHYGHQDVTFDIK